MGYVARVAIGSLNMWNGHRARHFTHVLLVVKVAASAFRFFCMAAIEQGREPVYMGLRLRSTWRMMVF